MVFLFTNRLVEQNTDDILNNPEKCEKNKFKSQEDVEETVSKRKHLFIQLKCSNNHSIVIHSKSI